MSRRPTLVDDLRAFARRFSPGPPAPRYVRGADGEPRPVGGWREACGDLDLTGVFCNARGRYEARLYRGATRLYLGTFDTPQAAAAAVARRAAELDAGGPTD